MTTYAKFELIADALKVKCPERSCLAPPGFFCVDHPNMIHGRRLMVATRERGTLTERELFEAHGLDPNREVPGL